MSTSTIDYIFREVAISYLGRNDLAQVTPDDLRSDSIGKKDQQSSDEDDDNTLPLVLDEETPTTAETNVQTAPVVKAVPKNGNGHGTENGNGNGNGNGAAKLSSQQGTAVATTAVIAKLKGYEGDACQECGSLTLVRNGTCLKCMTCGATSGCS